MDGAKYKKLQDSKTPQTYNQNYDGLVQKIFMC